LLSDHISPPPPLPKDPECLPRKYLRPYVFQPYQAPAIAAPKNKRLLKDGNQLALAGGGRSLSRGVSAAERIAEDVEIEMTLSRRM